MEVKHAKIRGTRSPKFARRLRDACDGHDKCPPLHQGRLTWLKERLAESGLKISVESIRKWHDGEGRPKQEKCEKLAQVLKVDATWLYMGNGELAGGANSARLRSSKTPILPIAIRDDVIVEIGNLPLNLSMPEARKIANVVLALASPEG